MAVIKDALDHYQEWLTAHNTKLHMYKDTRDLGEHYAIKSGHVFNLRQKIWEAEG